MSDHIDISDLQRISYCNPMSAHSLSNHSLLIIERAVAGKLARRTKRTSMLPRRDLCQKANAHCNPGLQVHTYRVRVHA